MRTALFLALRDILKDKRILLMIVLVIGMGVAASLFIGGLFNGFSGYFTDVTINVVSGHLTVFPEDGHDYVTGARSVERKISLLPDVVSVSPRLAANAIASKGSRESAIRVTAFDPSKETKTTKLYEKVTEGEFLADNDNGVMLGYKLAESLKVAVGERVRISFGNGAASEYGVKGLISTGSEESDRYAAYMTNKNLGAALGVKDSASQIVIRLTNAESAEKAKLDVQQLGINGDVKTWKELSESVERIKRNFSFIFNIINLISLAAAALSISVVMFINVEHKTREIGILKAIGARNSFVTKVFLIQILLYAALGILGGNVAAQLLIGYTQANPLQFEMENTGGSIAIVPVAYASDILWATLAVFAVTLAAGVYPVIRASGMDVIEAIWKG